MCSSDLLIQIKRDLNAHADILAGLAAICGSDKQRTVSFQTLQRSSIEEETEASQVLNIDLGPSWMDPIVSFLKDDALPSDKRRAHQIEHKAARYWLSPDQRLYKRSFT